MAFFNKENLMRTWCLCNKNDISVAKYVTMALSGLELQSSKRQPDAHPTSLKDTDQPDWPIYFYRYYNYTGDHNVNMIIFLFTIFTVEFRFNLPTINRYFNQDKSCRLTLVIIQSRLVTNLREIHVIIYRWLFITR